MSIMFAKMTGPEGVWTGPVDVVDPSTGAVPGVEGGCVVGAVIRLRVAAPWFVPVDCNPPIFWAYKSISLLEASTGLSGGFFVTAITSSPSSFRAGVRYAVLRRRLTSGYGPL